MISSENSEIFCTVRQINMDRVERLRRRISITNDLYRCCLAEFFCTAMLLFGGTSTSAQFVLSRRMNGEYVCVAFGWGFSLVFAVYAGFEISGSHLNPAVSLFLLTMGRLSAIRCALYSLAQIAGGFFGAFFTYILYYDALNRFDNGTRYVSGALATAGIFSTYPQPYLSVLGGIADQLIGTAFLCICVSLITDRRNKIPTYFQPLLIGFTVVLIGICIGYNSGYAINPARDLGPRLFTLCAGWGWKVFSYQNYKWFWIPTFVPLFGAVIGAWMYQFFLGLHIPEDEDLGLMAVKHKLLDEPLQPVERRQIPPELSEKIPKDASAIPVHRAVNHDAHNNL